MSAVLLSLGSTAFTELDRQATHAPSAHHARLESGQVQTQDDPLGEGAVEPLDDVATPESTSGKQAEVSRKQAQAPRTKHYSQKRTSDEEGDDPEASTDDEEEEGTTGTWLRGVDRGTMEMMMNSLT